MFTTCQVAFCLKYSWLYMVQIRRKCLLYQCFLCGGGTVFPVRVEAERGLRPYGSGGCWAMVSPWIGGDEHHQQRTSIAENQRHNRTRTASTIQNVHS